MAEVQGEGKPACSSCRRVGRRSSCFLQLPEGRDGKDRTPGGAEPGWVVNLSLETPDRGPGSPAVPQRKEVFTP